MLKVVEELYDWHCPTTLQAGPTVPRTLDSGNYVPFKLTILMLASDLFADIIMAQTRQGAINNAYLSP